MSLAISRTSVGNVNNKIVSSLGVFPKDSSIAQSIAAMKICLMFLGFAALRILDRDNDRLIH